MFPRLPGSLLEILHVHAGKLDVVPVARQFEAPNWLPDGRMILNVIGPGPNKGSVAGQLTWSRQVAPSIQAQRIATTTITSPALTAAARHRVQRGGRKTISHLHAADQRGEPVRVTSHSPSYLHEVADGAWLVPPEDMRAPRRAAGLTSTRFTGGSSPDEHAGLEDGSESPDGRHISTPAAPAAQLWRMNGSEQAADERWLQQLVPASLAHGNGLFSVLWPEVKRTTTIISRCTSPHAGRRRRRE
jgi:hypothetical protein